MEIVEKARVEGWTDQEVVRRVLGGEVELNEIIMRRYNQRLYRVVTSAARPSILTAWARCSASRAAMGLP
jgi:hypothetical protein